MSSTKSCQSTKSRIGLNCNIFDHYVRDLSDQNTIPDLRRLCEIAYDLGKGIDAKLGKGQISCISVKDTLGIIEKEIKKDSNFLIIGKA